MTKRPREWLRFGGLLAVTLLVGVAFLGVADYRPSSALQRESGIPELSPAAVNAPAPVPTAAQPAADLSSAFTASAEVVRPAVVYIEAEGKAQLPRGFQYMVPQGQAPRQRGEGSGFLISPDGYILTNNHVVENADKLTVKLLDHREFDAHVVGTDPATDVAVIKIDGHDLPHVAIGNSDSVKIGQWVLAVGNPLGENFSFTVTAGIVSAKGRVLNDLRPRDAEYSIMDYIQTDAVINPGNSGGPLVNLSGQVVGINAAIASRSGYYQGYGFAIPMNLAREVADQLIRTGHVTRAILGISIRDVTPDDAAYVGLSEIQGVKVDDYSSDDSPARDAGIQPGDIIVALNGEAVSYVAQLQQRVGFMHPGQQVDVTVVRHGGERHTYHVRLAAAPTNSEQAVASQTTPDDHSQDETPHQTRIGLALRPVGANTTVGNTVLTSDQAGLAVMDFDQDGPAASHLIPWNAQGGPDIITHVNGQRVTTIAQFDQAVRDIPSGGIVSLRIWNPVLDRGRVERMRLP